MARYVDFKTNLNFLPHNRDIAIATDESSVKTSIRNIVFTDRYERFHKPAFGAGVPQRLFENIGRMSEYEIQTRTKEAIIAAEPRISDLIVKTSVPKDQYSILVEIIFTTINNPTPVTLQIILKRVR